MSNKDKNIIDINQVKPYKNNSRNHINIDKLVEILRVRGQLQPLVIDTRTSECLSGNARLKALKEAGINKVWVEYVTPADDKDAFKLSLEMNSQYGEYIESELRAVIKQLDIKDIEIEGIELAQVGNDASMYTKNGNHEHDNDLNKELDMSDLEEDRKIVIKVNDDVLYFELLELIKDAELDAMKLKTLLEEYIKNE